MIDLHCHILPGIDDGAQDLSISLEMARMSVADGVSVLACTPHILPGLYNNSGPRIRQATEQLQHALDAQDIPLQLVTGADIHIAPDFVAGLKSGHLLTLAGSRYVLVEPPHHVAPVRLEDLFFELLLADYVPILTHPERLTWIKQNYEVIQKMAQAGVWMQLTSGSLTGAFGRGPLYWSERMLDEGIVHILASDAHDLLHRPPKLSEGRNAAAKRLGDDEAEHLIATRPQGVISNELPSSLPMPGARDVSAGTAIGETGAGALAGNHRTDDGRSSPGSDRRRPGGLRRLTERLQRLLQMVLLLVACTGSLAGCGTSSNGGIETGLSAQAQGENAGRSTKTNSNSAQLSKVADGFASVTTPGNSAYKIGPQDVLEISVFKVPDLSRKVQVADSGSVNLPLVGEIQAAGRTAQEMERDLTARLGAKYLQNPQVSVYIIEYNSQRVTIEGAVRKPGVYPIRGKTSLLQSIAIAGGLDDTASTNDLVIVRNLNGKRSAARFDLGQIRAGKLDDPVIKPGDLIMVNASGAKAAFKKLMKAVPLGTFLLLL
jgi:protein-tyrosine phosphatase